MFICIALGYVDERTWKDLIQIYALAVQSDSILAEAQQTLYSTREISPQARALLLLSFSVTANAGYQNDKTWWLIYFSFVTLSTLGYADVLPLTVFAETLAVVEAVLGQFNLAVLVAGLIGAHNSDRERHSV